MAIVSGLIFRLSRISPSEPPGLRTSVMNSIFEILIVIRRGSHCMFKRVKEAIYARLVPESGHGVGVVGGGGAGERGDDEAPGGHPVIPAGPGLGGQPACVS